ncbi:MAG TPA: YciI family protein, partial [Kofleriaceae bacterium]
EHVGSMSGATRLERRDDMSDFILLFRSSRAERDEAVGSPERAQRSLEIWRNWVQDLESGGHIVDHGKPLQPTGKVVRKADVHDGPYVEVKDLVLGYMIVRAETIEAAITIAQSCPIVTADGGNVEVRPTWGGM